MIGRKVLFSHAEAVSALLIKVQFGGLLRGGPVLIERDTLRRQVDWLFAICEGIELQAIYLMKPAGLDPYFSKWEQKWHNSGGKDINNPKIPIKFVVERGELIYRKPE
jgi:hypothetical protein